MDDAGGVSDSQRLQTLAGGHWKEPEGKKKKKNRDRDDGALRKIATSCVSVVFTQKDVSAGAHVSPPLLHDVVKLVS